jgi:fumarate reductase flavoprotein subunit
VKLTKPELVSAITNATGGAADPALADAVAGDCGRAVEWLNSHGAEFTRGSTISWHGWVLAPPRRPVAGPDWRGRGPDLLLTELRRRLEERGGSIFFGTRAAEIRMAGLRSAGVSAESRGAQVAFDAGAVVVADGGFPANSELFREFIGPRPDLILQRNAGTATGDGLRMAQQVGAAVIGLDRFYGHLLSRNAMHNEGLSPYPQIDAVAEAGIVIDPAGRRLFDEGAGGIAIANHLARLADPLCATVICDAAIWESAGRAAQIAPNPHLESAGGTLYRAQTMTELARLAGLSPDGLSATVVAYNAALRDGEPSSMTPARSSKTGTIAPIIVPPFFAIPICAGITNTMGGIAIDADGRVLRNDGSAIDGLYAAGGTTGGLEGGGDRVGYVGGLIKACVFGLRAAEHAADGNVFGSW